MDFYISASISSHHVSTLDVLACCAPWLGLYHYFVQYFWFSISSKSSIAQALCLGKFLIVSLYPHSRLLSKFSLDSFYR